VAAALRAGTTHADLARFALAAGADVKAPLGELVAAPGPDGAALLDAVLALIDLEPYSFDEALRCALDQCQASDAILLYYFMILLYSAT
jgi:hypothetical protein